MMTNNVIGQIHQHDWNTLRMLRQSINFMKSDNPAKWQSAIADETGRYNRRLGKYTQPKVKRSFGVRKSGGGE